MNLPIFPDSNVLTHSAEACFKACPRRYFLRYVLGIRRSQTSDALRIGSAFHAGLEVAKGGGTEMDAFQSVRNAYDDATCPPWLTDEKYNVEREIAASMVLAWCRRWAGDMIVDYIEVEKAFDLPIVNPATNGVTPNYRSAGKIDGIAVLPDGRIALVEHKTTAESLDVSGDYFTRLQLDGQVSRYVLAARSIGFDVQTTVYDVMRKPMIRPRSISKSDRERCTAEGNYFGLPLTATCPDRETAEMFGARLLDDCARRPEFYFVRVEIPRMAADLDEYRAEQWAIMRMIAECNVNSKRWGRAAYPRNTGSCVSQYTCEYLPVCKGMTGDPEETIPDGYRRVERLHSELAALSTTGAQSND